MQRSVSAAARIGAKLGLTEHLLKNCSLAHAYGTTKRSFECYIGMIIDFIKVEKDTPWLGNCHA